MRALILGLVLATGAGQASSGLIEPPFVRKWTVHTGDGSQVHVVKGHVAVVGSNRGIVAVDLRNGKQLWTALSGKSSREGVVVGDQLYVVQQRENDSIVSAVALSSHKARTVKRFQGGITALGADKDRLYLLDEQATVHALSVSNGRPIWKKRLVAKSERDYGMGRILATNAGLVVTVDDLGHHGMDPSNGRVRWRRGGEFLGLYGAHVFGTDVVLCDSHWTRVNLLTGKVVWESKQSNGEFVASGNVAVDYNTNEVAGRSVATGKTIWTLKVPTDGTYAGFRPPPTVTNGDLVWLHQPITLCVSHKGKLVWSRKDPFTGSPFYADDQFVATWNYNRLLGYRSGSLPRLPNSATERKKLAEQLAARFEDLDEREVQELPKLKPYVFRPLLAKYVDWARRPDQDKKHPDSFEVYTSLSDMGPILDQTFERTDTGVTAAAIARLGEENSWKGTLEAILQKKGDPQAFIPQLVASLRNLAIKDRDDSPALSAVSHSSHPQAVALMMEALRDPKAAPAWRLEAFRHLAGTGGEEGVAAVRALRPQRTPQTPWYDRFDFQTVDPAALTLKTDVKGRTWAAFATPRLGNVNDLLIVEKTGNGWGRPLFTGLWSGRVFGNEAPKLFRGIPTDQVRKSEWIKLFPDDTEIRKDTDGDTLTDVVEARLGTDAKAPDTDADGLKDAVDPCPNAAPRLLNDAEKIYAVAIDARFFEQDWKTPAVISIDDVKPFEFYGYKGQVLWEAGGRQGPLGKVYGGGVNSINFHSPKEEAKSGEPDIEFGPDKKTARTIISRYSGGLNGDGTEVVLKKIGDDWFVVDMFGRYVS